jgi:hypothetical protein
LRCNADVAKLLRDDEPMHFVADHDGGLDFAAELAGAQQRVLKKRSLRDERQ